MGGTARNVRTEPAVEILGIDHVVLRVSDVARSIAFYCDVLGCKVEKRHEQLGLVQLRAGGSLIDLVEIAGKLGRLGGAAPGEGGRNMDHFAVRVATLDPDAIRGKLAAHGVTAGEVVQRYGAEGRGPSLYIRDPDGNTVELKGPSRD
ncbi:MAG TPA: VOC family protein [Alphaproteobacteria bacterium]|nr:VOC family protein [Alphaproteobacteria bacterium]